MQAHRNAEPAADGKRKLKHILIVGSGIAVSPSTRRYLQGVRIIAGHFRSRLLSSPPGSATRPTSDRLRETLFNVIGPRVVDARFADLYAGSGAVGLEALSRGAASCIAVEQAPAPLQAIRKNLSSLQLDTSMAVYSTSVHKALQKVLEQKLIFDLVFLDPPYQDTEEYSSTLKMLAVRHEALLASDALVIAEHARRSPLPANFGVLVQQRVLEQGDAALSFYAVREPSPELV